MVREIHQWYSPALNKEMPLAVYGHYGFALLMVPTAAADYLEYERFELINALKPFIDNGKLKIFSVNSINTESWMNKQMEGAHKAIRQNQFNEYIFNEVVPFIKTMTSQDTPIITCGASFGAFHSMNLFLKRPDLINGVIAMNKIFKENKYELLTIAKKPKVRDALTKIGSDPDITEASTRFNTFLTQNCGS